MVAAVVVAVAVVVVAVIAAVVDEMQHRVGRGKLEIQIRYLFRYCLHYYYTDSYYCGHDPHKEDN